MSSEATLHSVTARRARIQALGWDYGSQPKEPVEICNLCGSGEWTVLTHRDRYGYAASATACPRCSLTVLNPRMSLAGYGAFYRTVYRPLVSAYHGRRIDAKSIQDEQRVYARELADLVAPLLRGRAGADLLDVGGSTGIVAAHLMSAFGLRATIIDPAPQETAEASARGIKAITGFVETWEPDRTYDIVGMFQTIDHLLDMASTLNKLRRVVADDGLLLFDIVDFRAAYLRNWSLEEAVKVDHPYSLTQLTTESYLARTGFHPVLRSFSPDHLHILYVCRPVQPQAEHLPSSDQVLRFFEEVRTVQNAPVLVRARQD